MYHQEFFDGLPSIFFGKKNYRGLSKTISAGIFKRNSGDISDGSVGAISKKKNFWDIFAIIPEGIP